MSTTGRLTHRPHVILVEYRERVLRGDLEVQDALDELDELYEYCMDWEKELFIKEVQEEAIERQKEADPPTKRTLVRVGKQCWEAYLNL